MSDKFPFFFFLKCIADQRKTPLIYFASACVCVCICSFLKLVSLQQTLQGVLWKVWTALSAVRRWLLFGSVNESWGFHAVVRCEGTTNLTGLLVRDTRRDSRQWNSFSSVMPERSSWTYSWDESVNSCLLFLSPPCEQNGTKNHLPPQRSITDDAGVGGGNILPSL